MRMQVPKEVLPGFLDYTYRRPDVPPPDLMKLHRMHTLYEMHVAGEIDSLDPIELFRFTPDELRSVFTVKGLALKFIEVVDVEMSSTFDEATRTHKCELFLVPSEFCRARERRLIGSLDASDDMMSEPGAERRIIDLMIYEAAKRQRSAANARRVDPRPAGL